MLGGLQRQLCVGMNSLHAQINTISEDFSSFKCEIFKKRSSIRKVYHVHEYSCIICTYINSIPCA